jgi:hypothetical protein
MPALTPEDWAQIRHDYEHTARPIEEICAAHGISSGTLRDRVRRWGWQRRRPPIPREGPAAMVGPSIWIEAPQAPHPDPVSASGEREQNPHPDPPPQAGEGEERTEPSPHLADDRPIGQHLQSAVARVLPAIETTLATLAAGPMQPRQMEQAARALGSLTRTLRELNGLLAQHAVQEPPQNIEALRESVMRTLNNMVASEMEDRPRRYLAAWEDFAAEAEAADTEIAASS